jgi:hypothetical protein
MAAGSFVLAGPAALLDRNAGRMRAVAMLSARIDAQKKGAATSSAAAAAAAVSPRSFAAASASASSAASFASSFSAPALSSGASRSSSSSSFASAPVPAAAVTPSSQGSSIAEPMELDCSDDERIGGVKVERGANSLGVASPATDLDDEARRAMERADAEAFEEEFESEHDDLNINSGATTGSQTRA